MFFAEGEQIKGTNYYFTKDHLGSIREMVNSSGAIQVRYGYDPYGRLTKVSGTMYADFAYAGYYYHLPSGLYLTLYRGYDSDCGRWLSHDPLSEIGGLNLYDYVKNDPINMIDQIGLQGLNVPDGTGVSAAPDLGFPPLNLPGPTLPALAPTADQIELQNGFRDAIGECPGVIPTENLIQYFTHKDLIFNQPLSFDQIQDPVQSGLILELNIVENLPGSPEFMSHTSDFLGPFMPGQGK